IINFTSNLPDTSRVLIDPAKTSITLTNALGDKAIRGTVPVAMMKACKNEVQISGTRAAMERDGVAMVRALMAIEHAMASGEKLTEMSIAELLTDLRSKQDLYFDNSFETIAGFRSHGAIVHYEATPATDVTLEPDGLLLIDSGAQYLDGTTDITRTITLGNPTPQQRHDFTLVMKGHIALGSMIFPEGTTGHQLDAIARQYLWKEGLTYLHGTGHGVGHFLNVHEGPQSIRLNHVPTPLTPGMITSNEPGLYREGIHGIRCENLVLTVNAMTTEFGNFYRFETLTLCPFDLRLFDTTIMTDDEIAWLNDYHAQVRQRLSPLLTDEERKWLETNTQPLKR
ncbi:MAG: aminopeptidase P family protein, partial [Muribaculaceae bacterium]|nr:aminopeptidase P family protein [Muribaculaceae bacterium]